VILIRELDDFPDDLRGGAVTIGNFDGVHRGHARIIERLRSAAQQVGGPAVVFTFDPHPVRLLRPHAAPPPLTWTDRKAELLADLGIEAVVAYRTNEELLQLGPREFFDFVIRDRLDARALVEGPNFYFGRERAGDVQTLGTFCRDVGISLEVVEPLQNDGQLISSSRVRQLIRDGKLQEARSLLTQPYRIRGMVTHGDARGARIGFPTANLSAIDTLLPAEGVYAGRAAVNEQTWAAAINIGPNPTFGEQSLKVEVHLVDYEGLLYGTVLEVDFLARLREIHPFESVAALKEQLARDVEATRQWAATTS
jgi:riboflavin kinase/FMN adenylyltransferase